jgi:hypothetical protein
VNESVDGSPVQRQDRAFAEGRADGNAPADRSGRFLDSAHPEALRRHGRIEATPADERLPVTWSGFAGANVDVRRSRGSTFVTANGSSYRESWRGSGTVGYTICETGSTTACASRTTTI